VRASKNHPAVDVLYLFAQKFLKIKPFAAFIHSGESGHTPEGVQLAPITDAAASGYPACGGIISPCQRKLLIVNPTDRRSRTLIARCGQRRWAHETSCGKGPRGESGKAGARRDTVGAARVVVARETTTRNARI
jgi:hypothetical protein